MNIGKVIGGLITSITVIIFNNVLINQGKIKFKWQFLLYILLFCTITFFLNTLDNSLLRILINFLFFCLANFFMFPHKGVQVLYTSTITYIILFLCDFLCAFIIMIIYQIQNIETQQEFYTVFMSNIIVSTLMLFIIGCKRTQKLLTSIVQKLNKTKNYMYIFLSMITILFFTIQSCLFFLELDLRITIILNILLMISYFFVIMLMFQTKMAQMELQIKYTNIIHNLKDYEKIIQQLRMNNHENNNNIITLRGLISKRNIKALNFVDNLLQLSFNDDDQLLYKTKLIPLGGLQGLIYQKSLAIKEKNITYFLDISNKINHKLINKITDKDNVKICMIIGIFIDNAIQAVESYKKRIISISLYCVDNYFVIEIANNFNGELLLDEMYNPGFSSKGMDRGYGLAIVKKIIDENKNFKNIQKINKDIFIQELRIKLK